MQYKDEGRGLPRVVISRDTQKGVPPRVEPERLDARGAASAAECRRSSGEAPLFGRRPHRGAGITAAGGGDQTGQAGAADSQQLSSRKSQKLISPTSVVCPAFTSTLLIVLVTPLARSSATTW